MSRVFAALLVAVGLAAGAAGPAYSNDITICVEGTTTCVCVRAGGPCGPGPVEPSPNCTYLDLDDNGSYEAICLPAIA